MPSFFFVLVIVQPNKFKIHRQGSHKNSKTQFHDFSMIFDDQQCNFHNYLMHGLQPFSSIFTTLVDHACILK